jgi:hypothetical protein
MKDVMEASKNRLTGDIVRDATKAEVQDIKRENTLFSSMVNMMGADFLLISCHIFL